MELNEYSDRPGHFGMATQSMEYVYDVSSNGLKYGFQVNTHAIGDRANREVLNQYQKVFNENPPYSFIWPYSFNWHLRVLLIKQVNKILL